MPKPRQKRKPFNRERREQFLKILRDGWSEEWAIRDLDLNRAGYYRYKNDTPEWVDEVEDAKKSGIVSLEDEAHRRGKRGILEPVVSGGRIVTYRRTFSDKLLSMALRARSSTYAPAQSTGAHFEGAISGAAERLLSRLVALAELADAGERAFFEDAFKTDREAA